MLTFRRTPAALAISALSVIALAGCGSDDSGDPDFEKMTQGSGSSAESSSGSSGHGGVDPEDVVIGDIHSAGEEVEFTIGKQYDYGDGRVEFGSDAKKQAVSVSDFRKVDIFSSPDPDAPADHPSAQGERKSSMLCYDVTHRMVQAPEGEKLTTPDDAVFTTRILWDGKINGDELVKYNYTGVRGQVPPGETVLNDETRDMDSSYTNESEHSKTYTECYSTDMKNAENTSGEIPEGMDGIILTLTSIGGSDSREPHDASWRLELEK